MKNKCPKCRRYFEQEKFVFDNIRDIVTCPTGCKSTVRMFAELNGNTITNEADTLFDNMKESLASLKGKVKSNKVIIMDELTNNNFMKKIPRLDSDDSIFKNVLSPTFMGHRVIVSTPRRHGKLDYLNHLAESAKVFNKSLIAPVKKVSKAFTDLGDSITTSMVQSIANDLDNDFMKQVNLQKPSKKVDVGFKVIKFGLKYELL